jgi:hypothetical protein
MKPSRFEYALLKRPSLSVDLRRLPGRGGIVAAPARPVGEASRPALGKSPAPVPHSLFSLFYLVEIRHRQLLQSQSRTRSRVPMATRVRCEYGNYMIAFTILASSMSVDQRWSGLAGLRFASGNPRFRQQTPTSILHSICLY